MKNNFAQPLTELGTIADKEEPKRSSALLFITR